MNKTEQRYADHLDTLRLAREIRHWLFESVGLRLADNTFYYPDFLVITSELVEYHEVKGHWEDDARVKIKVVAELYPWFVFRAVKADGKNWIFEDF